MSELVAEVCRAHVAVDCKACDTDDDELWIHPRDLNTCDDCGRRYAIESSFYDEESKCPGCGDLRADVDDCRLCGLLIKTREQNISILRDRIAMNEAEIAEIRRGDRHNDFHRNARLSQPTDTP